MASRQTTIQAGQDAIFLSRTEQSLHHKFDVKDAPPSGCVSSGPGASADAATSAHTHDTFGRRKRRAPGGHRMAAD